MLAWLRAGLQEMEYPRQSHDGSRDFFPLFVQLELGFSLQLLLRKSQQAANIDLQPVEYSFHRLDQNFTAWILERDKRLVRLGQSYVLVTSSKAQHEFEECKLITFGNAVQVLPKFDHLV